MCHRYIGDLHVETRYYEDFESAKRYYDLNHCTEIEKAHIEIFEMKWGINNTKGPLKILR